MSDELEVKLSELKKGESFWFTSVKFTKVVPMHDEDKLLKCQIYYENAFVYIDRETIVHREL